MATAKHVGVLLPVEKKMPPKIVYFDGLHDLQKLVGGYIETLAIKKATIRKIPVDVAVVDEEGLSKNLPINEHLLSMLEVTAFGPVLLTTENAL